jgi:DNA-binding MarR family transcriptional regulator
LYDATVGPVPPDDQLRGLMRRLVRTMGALEPHPERHEHAGVQVSTSEVFALGELLEAGPLSQQDLGARLGLEKSTVSRLAAGLEKRGWLERQRQDGDRRLYRIGLTTAGTDVARRIGAELRDHHAGLLDRLSPAEREGLLVGLAGLIRELQADHERAGHDGAGHRHPETP